MLDEGGESGGEGVHTHSAPICTSRCGQRKKGQNLLPKKGEKGGLGGGGGLRALLTHKFLTTLKAKIVGRGDLLQSLPPNQHLLSLLWFKFFYSQYAKLFLNSIMVSSIIFFPVNM